MNDDRDLQRQVTMAALHAIHQHGFVLAGSGAIREHGIVDRLTHDVDLFTNNLNPAVFDTAVDDLTAHLHADGYTVELVRRTEQFASLHVGTTDGRGVEMDLAIDWREQDPAQLQVGPVLHADDAVASKINALFTRAEARDFIDADAIRASGRYTDTDLLGLVEDRDAGFDRAMFADQLDQVVRIPADRFTDYGLDAVGVDALRTRTQAWAAQLRLSEHSEDSTAPALATRSARPSATPGRDAAEQRRDQQEHFTAGRDLHRTAATNDADQAPRIPPVDEKDRGADLER